jgi:hypothetical protein
MQCNYYIYNNYVNEFNYNKITMNILNINLKDKVKIMNIFNHKSNIYCN